MNKEEKATKPTTESEKHPKRERHSMRKSKSSSNRLHSADKQKSASRRASTAQKHRNDSKEKGKAISRRSSTSLIERELRRGNYKDCPTKGVARNSSFTAAEEEKCSPTRSKGQSSKDLEAVGLSSLLLEESDIKTRELRRGNHKDSPIKGVARNSSFSVDKPRSKRQSSKDIEGVKLSSKMPEACDTKTRELRRGNHKDSPIKGVARNSSFSVDKPRSKRQSSKDIEGVKLSSKMPEACDTKTRELRRGNHKEYQNKCVGRHSSFSAVEEKGSPRNQMQSSTATEGVKLPFMLLEESDTKTRANHKDCQNTGVGRNSSFSAAEEKGSPRRKGQSSNDLKDIELSSLLSEDGDAKAPNKLSKRTEEEAVVTTEDLINSLEEDTPQKAQTAFDKVRKSLSRSLSEMGFNRSDMECSENMCDGKALSGPQKPTARDKKVRKSFGRSLSELDFNRSDMECSENVCDGKALSGPQKPTARDKKVRKSFGRSLSALDFNRSDMEDSDDVGHHKALSGVQKRTAMGKKVRKSFGRSLSELGFNRSDLEDSEDVGHYKALSGVQKRKPMDKVRKSFGRSLSELGFNRGNIDGNNDDEIKVNISPVIAENKKEKKSLLRSLSDMDLNRINVKEAEDEAFTKASSKKAKRPVANSMVKSRPLNRLGPVKNVLKLRRGHQTEKKTVDHIENASLSQFELDLTCNLWSDDVGVVALAFRNLGSLCSRERESSLKTLEMVGSGTAIGALRKWYSDTEVQIEGLHLLSLISFDMSDRFVEGAVRCGAFEIVMNAMENNPEDQTLQEYACGALFTLVNTECSYPSVRFIAELEALPTLLRPLMTFPSHAEIRKNVTLTFSSVKRFEVLHKHLELGDMILNLKQPHGRHKQPQDHPRPEHPNHPKQVSNIICVDDDSSEGQVPEDDHD